MIDSRCMADCYPPVTVGGGGLLVILSLPRGGGATIYSIIHYLFYCLIYNLI